MTERVDLEERDLALCWVEGGKRNGPSSLCLCFGLGLREHDDESDSAVDGRLALDAEHTEVVHRRVKGEACSYEHGVANEVRGRRVRWHCNAGLKRSTSELNVRKKRR
jgi:hypothetical protein